MNKKILTSITLWLLFFTGSAQCYYEKFEVKGGIAYSSRRTHMYERKRSLVSDVYLLFEKTLVTRFNPWRTSYTIVVDIDGRLGAEGFSILRLTYYDDKIINLYLPHTDEVNVIGSSMGYEAYGDFEPHSPEVEGIANNSIKSAILINEDNKYITLDIPPAYFVDAFNCVKNLN